MKQGRGSHWAPGPVVVSTEPRTVISALLDHLRGLGKRGREKAAWIEDVNSLVIAQIEEDRLVDPAWFDTLIDDLCEHLNAVSRLEPELQGFHFGERRCGEWGWWRDPHRPV